MQQLRANRLLRPLKSKQIFVLVATYYVVALVLLSAGVFKLYDASGILEVLNQLSFLNKTAVTLIATLFPILELGLGVALFAGFYPRLIL